VESSLIFDWHYPTDQPFRATGRSAEAEALGALPESRIVDALNSLSDGERTVIYYVYVEGYRYNEIAEAPRIPSGTVASRIFGGAAVFGRRWRRQRPAGKAGSRSCPWTFAANGS
jgi:DNA-directed RNA polymerase specialized sigma24 family protein